MMISLMDVKENKVLSVIIENFNFEYDESILNTIAVFHNTEEAKIQVDTIDVDYEPSLLGLKEVALRWYRKQPFYLNRYKKN